MLLQHLPLEEDLEENVTLFRCICRLYELRHEQFLKNLPQILRLVLGVIKTNQVTPGEFGARVEPESSVHSAGIVGNPSKDAAARAVNKSGAMCRFFARFLRDITLMKRNRLIS